MILLRGHFRDLTGFERSLVFVIFVHVTVILCLDRLALALEMAQ
jgi:hypothetical protein